MMRADSDESSEQTDSEGEIIDSEYESEEDEQQSASYSLRQMVRAVTNGSE